MTVVKHKQPCSQCPFRQTSLKGWLGASTPEEFVEQTLSQGDMPCHKSINYEDPNWEGKLANKPHCAGSLIFLRNAGVREFRPEITAKISQFKTDYTNVLVGPGHFIQHHSLRRKA